ncbi:hypothetical protein [Salinicoccus roseus]|uniref:hypothetical protein n=1 Tax=Salinicoccus roseus TaxID=45670 RepID=UPI003561B796
MQTFKHYVKLLLPEITFTAGIILALVAMASMMGWQYALFFGGAVLLIVSLYLHNVMNTVIDDE